MEEFNTAARNRDGRENQCKVCRVLRAKKLRHEHPEKYRAIHCKRDLRRKYNITEEDYNHLLEKQDDSCAICNSSRVNRKTSSYFHIDHDHQTGKIRGLLCHPCNLKIAWFEEYDILGYLEEYDE